MLMKKMSGNNDPQDIHDPKDYWDHRFDEYAFHHSRQNNYIASDFLSRVPSNAKFAETFGSAQSLLEVGCGTGEFCQLVAKQYPQMKRLVGTDISEEGIQYGRRRNKFQDRVQYEVFNSLSRPGGFAELGQFDLALCSNVLEHFTDPYPLIEQMLDAAKTVCILVPYNHLSEDTSLTGDGGEGHVFRFTEQSFDRYDLSATFRFQSKGWSNVTNHPDPWQLAVLIRRKRS